MKHDTYLFGNSSSELLRLRTLNRILNPYSQAFIRDAGIKPGMRVLDVACGYGIMSCWLAEFVGPQGFVTAIDINSELIRLSEEYAREKQIHNIEFKVLSAYDAAKFGETFDAVYHRLILDHLTSPKAAVKAMHACLKPGAMLISESAIHSHCYSDPICESYDLFIKLIKQLFSSQGKNYDTGKSLYTMLSDAGFTHIRCQSTQALLASTEEKSLMSLALENAKAALIQENVTDQGSLDNLVKNLIAESQQSGIWAMPAICHASAIKLSV